MRLILGFTLGGLIAGLLRWGRHLLPVGAFHPLFKALYCTTQVAAKIAKFPGAEYQDNDYQNDQPVPNAE